jgi:Galactose oxidase-like, Early set domain
MNPMPWLREHRRSAVLAVALTAVCVVSLAGQPAYADANLVANPSLEVLDSNGFPICWEPSGWGDNSFQFAVTPAAHSGTNAMRVTVNAINGGDRKAMMLENPSCAPNVAPDHQYDLSVWYTTTTPDTVVTMFRHDVALGWQYWTDLSTLQVTSVYTQKTVRTPPVPADTDQITWGVTIYGVGTLTTDDYAMVDATVPAPGDSCSAGPACTQGVWQVMPFTSPVRAIHAVVLYNGNVLLAAGSGNDPDAFAAGTFTSAVYQPKTGTFVNLPTPADLFCSGHVQLPDGRVLIMGGNKAYPTAAAGYEGLKTSYVFDPATNAYTRINDLNAGHWYPSATELGNGDVVSLGGLGEDSSGTVATEYFSYPQQRWLALWEAHQTWSFWGLYPSMVLMQDGRLFYTGSHVFGNGLPGTGASIYDYGANTVTPVSGLQDKDERDQSMSVLLPPAQSQKVLTIGGGNINTNPDANRYTDLIDLKQATPTYTPGPLLPTGLRGDGTPETSSQGKMYVSAVILPDGKVFETGGGLHNRADPVYEASMYDPDTNTFTGSLATDPVPRTYHSSAFLLPDGRVMAIGDNPGNGTFEMRISIYTPPYLFNGARPQVRSVASQSWGYGSTQQITVDSTVVRAALIRPAAVTHSSDPNQRYVELPMTVDGNTIGLNMTSNPNIAPPGWYMLFVVNAAGVPSVASWVRVG